MVGYIIVLTEALALLIATFRFIKQRNQSNALLLCLLCMVVLNESASLFHWYSKVTFFRSNAMLLFNSTLLMEVLFYLLIIQSVINDVRRKRKLVYVLLFYLSSLLALFLFLEQPQTRFTIISFCLGSVLTLVYIMVYFYEQIVSGMIASGLKNFWNWIFAFLLFFLAVEIPFMCVFNYALDHADFFVKHTWVTNFKIGASCVYYLSYIFGFIWENKK